MAPNAARMTSLTHWGRVTHICVGNLIIIDSDNGLLPDQLQAIIWTYAEILLIGPLWTNFSEILIEILTLSFKKMCLIVSSVKWRPFCLGLSVLKPATPLLSWKYSPCIIEVHDNRCHPNSKDRFEEKKHPMLYQRSIVFYVTDVNPHK